jgi:hypothetical protein
VADLELKGILIATPCYGGEIKMQTHAAISQLRASLGHAQIANQEYTVDMCDIEEVRNSVLTFWFDNQPEYDHLLMVDNDMHFDPNVVVQMLKLNKPLVGVTYHKRQLDPNGDVWKTTIGETLEDRTGPIINGFQEWKYVGAGVLLIKREVVKRCSRSFPSATTR